MILRAGLFVDDKGSLLKCVKWGQSPSDTQSMKFHLVDYNRFV